MESAPSNNEASRAGLDGPRYSNSKKRGCPTCDGVDPKSCMRCWGKTRLCDWVNTQTGWTPNVKLSGAEGIRS